MEPLPRSWLIMVSLCTILHGHGIFAKIMARSWQQDLGNASKEIAMNLGKDTMLSNTGNYQYKTNLLPWNPWQEHG